MAWQQGARSIRDRDCVIPLHKRWNCDLSREQEVGKPPFDHRVLSALEVWAVSWQKKHLKGDRASD